MQTVPASVTNANIKTNTLSDIQIQNMRRRAADNIKATSRNAKHNVKPPRSVYKGQGNLFLYVKDTFPYFSEPTLRFLVEKVNEYANKENDGEYPGEGSLKLIAKSYGLKVRTPETKKKK